VPFPPFSLRPIRGRPSDGRLLRSRKAQTCRPNHSPAWPPCSRTAGDARVSRAFGGGDRSSWRACSLHRKKFIGQNRALVRQATVLDVGFQIKRRPVLSRSLHLVSGASSANRVSSVRTTSRSSAAAANSQDMIAAIAFASPIMGARIGGARRNICPGCGTNLPARVLEMLP
jgi:hypothetical protein